MFGLYAKSRILFDAWRNLRLLAGSCCERSRNQFNWNNISVSFLNLNMKEFHLYTFGNESGVTKDKGLDKDGTGTWYGVGEYFVFSPPRDNGVIGYVVSRYVLESKPFFQESCWWEKMNYHISSTINMSYNYGYNIHSGWFSIHFTWLRICVEKKR